MLRLGVLLLLLAIACGAAGCGGADDLQQRGEELRQRGEELRQRAEKARDRAQRSARRVEAQVREALDKLERAVPQATSDAQAPSSGDKRLEAYLKEVLTSVDTYWTKTLRASDVPEPRVSFLWIPPGRGTRTGCGAVADENAAFYCPADDTIFVGEELAADILRGTGRTFPGERAGYGKAEGDFGLAYVIAHEYAHNIQQELGLARIDPRYGVEPLELQADCMAGLWGNSVYREGKLKPGDVEEAISTVLAAGDFDTKNPQHHGTPDERRAAWLLGYRSGDPAACRDAAGV
jgi:predicted metalloprotease